jgi:hypothetical protein
VAHNFSDDPSGFLKWKDTPDAKVLWYQEEREAVIAARKHLLFSPGQKIARRGEAAFEKAVRGKIEEREVTWMRRSGNGTAVW